MILQAIAEARYLMKNHPRPLVKRTRRVDGKVVLVEWVTREEKDRRIS